MSEVRRGEVGNYEYPPLEGAEGGNLKKEAISQYALLNTNSTNDQLNIIDDENK